MVFGSPGHCWSRSNNCVLVLRSVGGCLGGRALPAGPETLLADSGVLSPGSRALPAGSEALPAGSKVHPA